jgi:surface antigen
MRRTVALAAASLLIPLAVATAAEPLAGVAGLNTEDRALIASAAARVVMTVAPLGSKAGWYNPHDNNGGLVTLIGIAGACRRARYDLTLASRTSSHSYIVAWCRQADGQWQPKP